MAKRAVQLIPVLAICLMVLCLPALADDTVGQVTRSQGQSMAMSSEGNRALAQGSIVARNDTLVTLEKSRLEAKLLDGAQLTLGENATLRIDDLVFNPADADKSRLALFADGAFRMITGKINSKVGAAVRVNTPVGTLSIRGTDFWTGPIDGIFGVLLISGEVVVQTAGGQVTLNQPGQGTNLTDAASAPGPVTNWPQDKVTRALSQVAF